MSFLRILWRHQANRALNEELRRRRYVSQFADRVESDVQGNSIAVLNGKGKPTVMLIGHCDEIGFMITHINDQGFIYFSAIGGVDLNILPILRVALKCSLTQWLWQGALMTRRVHSQWLKQSESLQSKSQNQSSCLRSCIG